MWQNETTNNFFSLRDKINYIYLLNNFISKIAFSYYGQKVE